MNTQHACLGFVTCALLACSGKVTGMGADTSASTAPSSTGSGSGSSESDASSGQPTTTSSSSSGTVANSKSGTCFADTPRVTLDTSAWFAAGNDSVDYTIRANAASAQIASKTAPIDASEKFATVMNQIPASGYSGRQRFSALVDTGSVSAPAWAGLWMRVDDAKGKTLAFDNMQDRPILSTAGYYMKYEVVLDVAPEAALVSLGVLLAGAGQATLFDAALEPVSADGSYASNPTRWFLQGMDPSHYALSPDPSTGRCGRPVAHLSNAGQPSGFGTILEDFAADELRGKRVRMRAPVRTSNVAGSAGLWMRVDGAAFELLSFDNMQNRPIVGSTDWQDYDVVLDVPSSAQQIAYGLILDGTGDAWIDVTHFEVVDASVPTTDH